jgi:hypothetical protein
MLVLAVWIAVSAPDAACQRMILPPRGEASERNRQIVAEGVARGIATDARCKVLSPGDVRAMLDLEADRQQCGIDESSCLVELGEALGADEVVAIEMHRVRDGYVVDARRIAPKTAEVLARAESHGSFDGVALADASAALGESLVADGDASSVWPTALLALGATTSVAAVVSLGFAGVGYAWAAGTLATASASGADKETALGLGPWLPVAGVAGGVFALVSAPIFVSAAVLE